MPMSMNIGEILVGIAMETHGLERSVAAIRHEFKALDVESQLLGKHFDADSAKAKALQSAIGELTRQGVKPNHEAIRELVAAHNKIQQEMEETSRATALAERRQRDYNTAVRSSQVVAAGVGVAIASITAATIQGIKQFASYEQSQVAFETLLGSAEAADAFLADLWDKAKATPYEFEGIQNAARSLMVYGFQAQEILPILTSIGDATAAMGGGGEERLGRIITALGQMKQAGRVTGEEMRQLTEAGINAWKYLADAIGVADAAAARAFIEDKDNILPVETAVNAIIHGMGTQFAGQMERQSQTLAGMFSTMQDLTMGQKGLLGEFGRMASESLNLKDNLDSLNNSLENLLELVQGKSLSEALDTLIPDDMEPKLSALAGVVGGAMTPAMIGLAKATWAATLPLLPFMAYGAAVGLTLWGMKEAADYVTDSFLNLQALQTSTSKADIAKRFGIPVEIDTDFWSSKTVADELARQREMQRQMVVAGSAYGPTKPTEVMRAEDQARIDALMGKGASAPTAGVPVQSTRAAAPVPGGLWSGIAGNPDAFVADFTQIRGGVASELNRMAAYAKDATQSMVDSLSDITAEFYDEQVGHSLWPDYRRAVLANIAEMAAGSVAGIADMVSDMNSAQPDFSRVQRALGGIMDVIVDAREETARGDMFGIAKAQEAASTYLAAGRGISQSLIYARDTGRDVAWNLGASFANASQMARDASIDNFGDIAAGLDSVTRVRPGIPIRVDGAEEAVEAIDEVGESLNRLDSSKPIAELQAIQDEFILTGAVIRLSEEEMASATVDWEAFFAQSSANVIAKAREMAQGLRISTKEVTESVDNMTTDTESQLAQWDMMMLGLLAVAAPTLISRMDSMGDRAKLVAEQTAVTLILNSRYGETALRNLSKTFDEAAERASEWHFTVRSSAQGGLSALSLLANQGANMMQPLKEELIKFLPLLHENKATWADFGQTLLSFAEQAIIAAEAELLATQTLKVTQLIIESILNPLKAAAALVQIPTIVMEVAAGLATLEAVRALLPNPKEPEEPEPPGLPEVPQMAAGGVVPPRPGGTLVNVAEAGETEAILPLSDLKRFMQPALAPPVAAATGNIVININHPVIREKFDIQQIGTELVRELKRHGLRP